MQQKVIDLGQLFATFLACRLLFGLRKLDCSPIHHTDPCHKSHAKIPNPDWSLTGCNNIDIWPRKANNKESR